MNFSARLYETTTIEDFNLGIVGNLHTELAKIELQAEALQDEADGITKRCYVIFEETDL
jgi:hypothetical protein